MKWRSRRTGGVLAGVLAVGIAITATATATSAPTHHPVGASESAPLSVSRAPGGRLLVAHWTPGGGLVTFYPLRGLPATEPADVGGATPLPPASLIAADVGDTETGAAMPPGFLGLSIEYHAIRPYLGRDPDAIDPVFVALLRGLDPGQSPVLRIGGDSTDQTWWPVPGVIPPGGITYSLTKDWLAVVHSLAVTLHARLILGINLAADSPSLAGAEARALIAGVGRRYVDALEIGNEPDVYDAFAWFRDRNGKVYFSRPRGYSFSDYLADVARWQAAMPQAPLAGPAFAQTEWMADLPAYLAAEPATRVVTFHRYPLRGCETDPTVSNYASIPNLLSDASSSGLAQEVAPYVTEAHAAGVPFRLDELNSASCTGRLGVSNTFASALWAVDALFNLADVGVDGVNIHTLPGAPYEPFTLTETGNQWSGSVRPLYYGLLMFEQAYPPGARLLSVNAPTGPVKIWATEATDGTVRVVLINKDPTTNAIVRVELPGAQTTVTAEALTAPSLGATSGVTLGGASFGASTTSGVLPAMTQTTRLSPLLGYYSVTVPAGSAMMLTN